MDTQTPIQTPSRMNDSQPELRPEHMSSAGNPQRDDASTRLLRRSAILFGAALVFVGVASVIKPPPQGATASPANVQSSLSRGTQKSISSESEPQGKLIGTMQGRTHLIRCYATNTGTRYTICTLEGRVLKTDLGQDDVYRSFPDLDVRNMQMLPFAGESGNSSEINADLHD